MIALGRPSVNESLVPPLGHAIVTDLFGCFDGRRSGLSERFSGSLPNRNPG